MQSPGGLSHDSRIGAYQRRLYLPEIPSDPCVCQSKVPSARAININ